MGTLPDSAQHVRPPCDAIERTRISAKSHQLRIPIPLSLISRDILVGMFAISRLKKPEFDHTMLSNEYGVILAVHSSDRNAIPCPRLAGLAGKRFAVAMNMIEIAVETGDWASDLEPRTETKRGCTRDSDVLISSSSSKRSS